MAASSASSVRSKGAGRPELIGCEEPRIWTPPLRPLTPETSLGFACIQFAEEVLEVELLPWQKWALIHALELLPDGTYRYRTVLILVARQNGKSTLMQILALWVMYVRGCKLVIGTAQNLDVAEEVWQGAVDMAQEVEDLNDEIAQVSLTNGKKFLKLDTGERYKVAAASRRGGRGLSGDLILLDELREHQTWDAWSAVTKTTMARLLAQVWAASNAGDMSSIVLRWLRKMAHLAIGDPDGLAEVDDIEPEEIDDVDVDELDDDTLGIFEWSAPPGCSIMDRAGWAQANPALGHTITERAIRSAARTDPEWVFRTEVLCQWIDGTAEGPFPSGSWEGSKDKQSKIADDSPIGFCVDVSWDRSAAHISAAGYRADGIPHVEIIKSGVGSDWVVDWFTDEDHPDRAKRPIAVQGSRAPASTLVQPLKDAGLDVVEWGGADLGTATGDLYDRIRAAIGEGREDEDEPSPGLRHRGQPVLDIAAGTAATRPSGDAWLWDRKKSPADAAPLVAATGALWVLTSYEPPKPKPEPRIRRLGGGK